MNINMDIISSLEIERIEHIFKTCLLQFGNNSKANPFLILLPKTLCFQQLLRSYSFFSQGYKSDGCVFRFQLYMKHQLRLLYIFFIRSYSNDIDPLARKYILQKPFYTQTVKICYFCFFWHKYLTLEFFEPIQEDALHVWKSTSFILH